MAAEPIHVEAEDEVPAVIERIRRSPADEVHLVLPPHARFGQSRFNFQLLKQYSTRLGKRVAIVSPDPSVQRFAEESGFGAFSLGDLGGQPGERLSGPGRVVIPMPGTPRDPFAAGGGGRPPAPPPGPLPPGVGRPGPAPGSSWLDSISRISRPGSGTRTPIRVGMPRRLPSLLERFPLSQYVLYGGAGVLLLVGTLAMAFNVPSARITLVVQAQAFSTAVDVAAEPNKPPIRVRTLTVTKSDSMGGVATANKTQAGQYAIGQFTYLNNCGNDLVVPSGQRLLATTGMVFAQLGDQVVPRNSSVTVNIKATQPGQAGNVGSDQITAIDPNHYACLTGTNVQATGGGTDDQKQTVIGSSDLQSVRAQLEQKLRQEILTDLDHGLQNGEKRVNDPVWQVSKWNTSHDVDENYPTFTGTLTLTAEADYYMTDDVDRVFADQLRHQVPSGKELTADKISTSYTVTATNGGHLDFNGTSSGFVTSTIDTARVRDQLVGRTGAQAHDLLDRLPISRADIRMSPIPLPLMPLSASHITIDYAVDQVVPPAKSP